MRVMVAMSGGVDSSVAAGILVEEGHEVIGLTMKLRDATPEEKGGQKGSCCSPDDLMDARVACDVLGIPHYVVDYREVFKREVIDPFAESYLQGQTPNPCVNCNEQVKFAPLLERAKALNADVLVTGHYARIEAYQDRYALYRGKDRSKDQSYFLFGISDDALAMSRFPLGNLDKEETRAIGKRLGLPHWDKADSEDICFVPNGKYASVVEKLVGPDRVPQPGPILNQEGLRMGTHNGLHHYTIGQRRGLHIATGSRVYVTDIQTETNTLVIGSTDDLKAHGLYGIRCRWNGGTPPKGLVNAQVQIRYRHRPVPVNFMAKGKTVEAYFSDPQTAVTPGQAVVFYDDDRVIGGGWIESALHESSMAISPFEV
jgi:tRNA-specific 2-thiouridylase